MQLNSFTVSVTVCNVCIWVGICAVIQMSPMMQQSAGSQSADEQCGQSKLARVGLGGLTTVTRQHQFGNFILRGHGCFILKGHVAKWWW